MESLRQVVKNESSDPCRSFSEQACFCTKMLVLQGFSRILPLPALQSPLEISFLFQLCRARPGDIISFVLQILRILESLKILTQKAAVILRLSL